MKLLSYINRLFILLLLSIGVTSISHAALFDDWSDNQLCEWMDQPSPPGIIRKLVNKRNINCSEGIASVETLITSSKVFDGGYSFTLIALLPGKGVVEVGHGLIEINKDIVTINKDSKGPKYDSFEGRIDNNGDIVASLHFNPCSHCGMEDKSVVFNGNIDKLKLNGNLSGMYDDIQVYFYLYIKTLGN